MPLKISPTQAAFNARGDGTFNKPFAEQVDFIQQKLNLPTERYDDILKSAHDRAFVVAGAMKADLLNDLRQAVDRSIAEGKSIQWFRKEFDNIVAKHGWTGWTGEGTKAGRDWRTRVIYRTNLSTSYAAGRWQQLNDPDLLKRRPYWKYIHNDTVLHPRPLHQSWSGMVLRHDDPFWQTHFPPNGWGCRCRVTAVSAREYKGHPAPDDGTYIYKSKDGVEHVLPKGIDYGWDYAPGASLSTPLQDFAQKKAADLPAKIAQDFSKSVGQARELPSIGRSFTLPSRGKTRDVAQHVIGLIDGIHTTPDMPTIPIMSGSMGAEGRYRHKLMGAPVDIMLNGKAAHPELTLAHEIGHFVDHQGVGAVGVYASTSDSLMADFRRIVQSSEAVSKLGDIRKLSSNRRLRDYVLYLLETEELWARAYAQYVTVKSGDARMLAQLNEIREFDKGDAIKFSQWSDEDFRPIMAAIDALFTGLGWLL